MSLLPKRSVGFHFQESGMMARVTICVGAFQAATCTAGVTNMAAIAAMANLAKFIVVFTIAVGLD
jgi:hypothetical protein